VDLAEFSAEVSAKYPLKLVRYAEVEKRSRPQVLTGGPGSSRELNMLIAKNVEAGRLVQVSLTPIRKLDELAAHEAREECWKEIYVYFDMPEPAYGIQLVYNDTTYPE